jgi:methionine-rich copper-binding protein CopC
VDEMPAFGNASAVPSSGDDKNLKKEISMLRKVKIAALAFAVVGLAAPLAQAHPRMKTSAPASGETIKASPAQIKMGFSESLIGRFTGIELSDAKGRHIQTGPAVLDPHDNTKFVVPVKQRLTTGRYNVAWHAVSVDTHPVSGTYSFKVAQ